MPFSFKISTELWICRSNPSPFPKWNPQYFYMCPKCYITYGYSIKDLAGLKPKPNYLIALNCWLRPGPNYPFGKRGVHARTIRAIGEAYVDDIPIFLPNIVHDFLVCWYCFFWFIYLFISFLSFRHCFLSFWKRKRGETWALCNWLMDPRKEKPLRFVPLLYLYFL